MNSTRKNAPRKRRNVDRRHVVCDQDGGKWTIIELRDGAWDIIEPGGNLQAWGTAYTLEDIMEANRLKWC